MKPTRSDHMSDADLALRGMSRETDIVLDAEGHFSSGSVTLTHPGIVSGFSRWIERTDAGRYVLRNDLHYVYLKVEGAPLHARGADLTDEGVELILQGGEREPLRPETLRQGPDGVLYASGRDGSWPVRLHPGAVLALGPLLEEDAEGHVALRVGATLYRIPQVADPLA